MRCREVRGDNGDLLRVLRMLTNVQEYESIPLVARSIRVDEALDLKQSLLQLEVTLNSSDPYSVVSH